MDRIAIISVILENPTINQKEFNKLVSEHRSIIRGKMGFPFDEHDMSSIAISVVASMEKINAFTGKLGNIDGCTVKTLVAKKEIE